MAVSASAGPGTPHLPPVLVPRPAVAKLRVIVPRDLTVSEANLFHPVGRIVWRGDLTGDRHRPVHA